MEICGDKWKSSDDMKAVLSRPSLASRFSFGERFPWWLHATTFSPRKRTTEGAAMESKPPLNKDGMVAYTSFSSMFYPGRAKVLAEEWPMVESALGEYGMSCKLDWDGRFITVATTTRTRGADIVYKARDLLHLLALTNVPPSMAIQILDGRLHCDIIWTANCYGGLLSKLSFKSKGQYFTRMKNIRRNVEGLVSVSGCSLFINGFSVTAISAIPEGLLTIRGIVTSCIVKGQNPGTAVRLLKLFQERNGQTENLEMDAYGFKTAPGAKLRFLKRLGGNPLVEQKNSELTLTRGDDVGELKPSIGNPRVEHKKSEDDPTPEVNHTEFSLFGPSLNKDGMLVCGSFFLDHRECYIEYSSLDGCIDYLYGFWISCFEKLLHSQKIEAVLEAWPLLKSLLEDYGISCTMYLAERFMTLSTTSGTEDPDIIYKARDVLELLSLTRVPPSMVMKVLNENLQYDIIKTAYRNGGFCSQYMIDRKLIKKRRGLLRPYLKELGVLTGCEIYVDGCAVTAMGFKRQGLKLVRIGVKECLVNNVRPKTMLRKMKLTLERMKMKEEITAGEFPPVESAGNMH